MTHRVRSFRLALAGLSLSVLAPFASAQLLGGPEAAIVLHGGTYGSGASLPLDAAVPDLSRLRFNDQASSITLNAGRWELCEHGNFGGRCEIVDASLADLSAIGLNDQVSSIRPASGSGSTGGTRPSPTQGDIIFYSGERQSGDAVALDASERDFGRLNFNDKARSLEVREGVWRVCSDAGFRGRCEYVDASIRSLADSGLAGQISSAERTPYDKGPQRSGIALFADGNFYGAFLGFDEDVPNLGRFNYNDTASSLLVNRGTWLVCTDTDYRGTCEVVDAALTDLNALGINDRISSLRRYDGTRRNDRDNDDRYGSGSGNGSGRGNGYGYGRDDDDDVDGVRGEETVFFARPVDPDGRRIRNADGAATRFCRDRGFSEAVYKGTGRSLSDVLCR